MDRPAGHAEHERCAIAMDALAEAGATEDEIVHAYHGLTVIDGKVTRIIACYVAEPVKA